jgi:hypothetical protein
MIEKEFIPYEQALALKELGFDEPCFGSYDPFGSKQLSCSGIYTYGNCIAAPLYQQAINFLYICSNKQIDIELKGSDTYEERIRKIEQGCKDLWNLQNNKSN